MQYVTNKFEENGSFENKENKLGFILSVHEQ